LEANAALRSIVRRDDFRSYQQFLTDLAQASGIPTPTREDLARIDRKRKKKGSNAEWVNPHDPDAQITKMKDGSTHLSHKQEHAVDMESGAVVAVTLHGGAEGDTSTIEKTLDAADENLKKARKLGDKAKTNEKAEESVGDKGYHSKAVMLSLELAGRRSYISEPLRPRQHWEDQAAERESVYANRRRKKGARGQRLMKKRGELIERSFAHTLETGGMRRTHLRFPLQHHQANAHPCRRLQSRPANAEALRRGHAARPSGPLGRRDCSVCRPDRRHQRPPEGPPPRTSPRAARRHQLLLPHAEPGRGVRKHTSATGC
jgi:transposase